MSAKDEELTALPLGEALVARFDAQAVDVFGEAFIREWTETLSNTHKCFGPTETPEQRAERVEAALQNALDGLIWGSEAETIRTLNEASVQFRRVVLGAAARTPGGRQVGLAELLRDLEKARSQIERCGDVVFGPAVRVAERRFPFSTVCLSDQLSETISSIEGLVEVANLLPERHASRYENRLAKTIVNAICAWLPNLPAGTSNTISEGPKFGKRKRRANGSGDAYGTGIDFVLAVIDALPVPVDPPSKQSIKTYITEAKRQAHGTG